MLRLAPQSFVAFRKYFVEAIPANRFPLGPSLRAFAAAFGFIVIGQDLVGVLIAVLPDSGDAALTRAFGQFAVGVGYAFAAIFLLRELPALAADTGPSLGFRAPRLRDVGIAALAASLNVAWSRVYFYLFPLVMHRDPHSGWGHYLTGFSLTEVAIVSLTVCLIVPLAEELVFRGLLFQWIRTYCPFWVSAVTVSFIFGAYHRAPDYLVSYFVTGLILLGAYRIGKSMSANVLTHVIINIIAVSEMFLNR